MKGYVRRFLVIGAVAAAVAFAVTGCALTGSGVATGAAPPSNTSPELLVASAPGDANAPIAASAAASAANPLQVQALKVKALAVTVNKYCSVGQPFFASIQSAITDQGALDVLAKVQAEAGKVCTVSASIANPVLGIAPPTLDLATVQSFANAQVPKLLTLVKNSDLNDTQKTAATLAISGAQAALLIAVVNAQ